MKDKSRSGIRFSKRLLLLLVTLACSCQTSFPGSSYWTNFEWTSHPDGGIISSQDSLHLPQKSGFEAIVKADSAYYYIKNLPDVNIYVQRYGDIEGYLAPGHFVYNEDSYFIYRYNWSNKDNKWKLVVEKLGSKILIEGDCLGFNDKALFVKNAAILEVRGYKIIPLDSGYNSEIYNYDLLPQNNSQQLDCGIYPP